MLTMSWIDVVTYGDKNSNISNAILVDMHQGKTKKY